MGVESSNNNTENTGLSCFRCNSRIFVITALISVLILGYVLFNNGFKFKTGDLIDYFPETSPIQSSKQLQEPQVDYTLDITDLDLEETLTAWNTSKLVLSSDFQLSCAHLESKYGFLGDNVVIEPTAFPFPRTNVSSRTISELQKWWETFCGHRSEIKGSYSVQNPLDLLLLGDSITERWRGQQYGRPLANNQASAFRKVFDEGFSMFANKLALGISGDRTQQLLFRIVHGELASEVLQSQGVVIKNVLVHIGINNILADEADVRDVAAGIINVLSFLTKLPAIGKVYFLPLLPYSSGHGTESPAEQTLAISRYTSVVRTNDLVKRWIRNDQFTTNLKILDCNSEVGFAKEHKLIPDHVHPSAEGMDLWSKCIGRHVG